MTDRVVLADTQLKSRPPVSRQHVPRPKLQLAIDAQLIPSQAPKGQLRLILHGTGGVGKTQLALDFARRFEDRYVITI